MFFYLFVCLFIGLYGSLNFYIGLRGWQLLGNRLSFINEKVYWIAFVIIILLSVIGTIGKPILPELLRNTFSLIGFYWIAAMIYFVCFIAMIDLMRVLDNRMGLLGALRNSSFFRLIPGLFIITLVAGLLIYGTLHARNIVITPYHISIPKQAGFLKQLHIVMISDLHLTDIGERRQKVIINKVNQLHPDLVMIPGDIVPIEKQKVTRALSTRALITNDSIICDLGKIKSKYGVYASLGNHDYLVGNMTELVNLLRQDGINVLRDNTVKVADSFYIVGRDDKSYQAISGRKRETITNLMVGINRELPVFLLDHQPIDLKAVREAGVDLQLSGHTHKGQIFPFNLITGRVFQKDYGYLETGNLQLIVSSGAGTWGPPVRIASSSEVVDIWVSFR